MKAALENFIEGAKGILGYIFTFILFIIMMMLLYSPVMLWNHFFGDNEPSKYDPADSNRDGIVTEAEDEYYSKDLSELYNGK
ncbi:hypothetical protein [Bacillus sp. UMB0728]|uniref:hypothetical protein n=1 Tax=Bacillus sp. UMB0728 TaxID=2066052 RepID=UPI000C75A1D5|nr:hypothetical protein [Bacillus sp. UMB0728]PLR72249.1 hypothetical protein CYJ37_11885 [Bacillus sp. UMB0728]